MTRLSLLLMPHLLVGLALAQAPPDACEGIALVDGQVNTARPLPVKAPLPAPDVACAGAVGAALKARTGLRSVTVAVRLPEATRAGPLGKQVGQAYTNAIAGGGVPAARIATVVPIAAHGEQDSVAITFTERKSRPVARIEDAEGTVKAGPEQAQLAAVKVGAELKAKSLVGTEAASRARVGLADGSRLKLEQDALIRLGRIQLNEKLQREVRLEILRGEVEADVRSGGPGSSFEIESGGVVAGVRGTLFRMRGGEDGAQVETLEGLVVLTSAGKTVEVAAGFAAAARRGQPPTPPSRLSPAPIIIGPLQGALAQTDSLRWQGLSGAPKYRVDVAADAEFIYQVSQYETGSASLPAGQLKLSAGKWFWRVRAVDAQGFGGQTSKVYAFTWGG